MDQIMYPDIERWVPDSQYLQINIIILNFWLLRNQEMCYNAIKTGPKLL